MGKGPPTELSSDAELIEKMNAGNDRAFEILYVRHRDWVVQLATRFLREGNQPEVALDVMQETFMWLLRQCPGFELRARIETVLYPVVRHAAYSKLRRLRTRESHRAAVQNEIAARHSLRAPTSSANPDDDAGALRDLLARLPEAQREVLILRFVDDLSVEEIAAAVQIPLGTAKTRLHHALRSLRENPATAKIYFG